MTSVPPGDASKAFNTTLFRNRSKPIDRRPHASCPICYLDSTSSDTCELLTHRCARGHEWLATRKQGEDHAKWLARYATGTEPNR